MGRPLGVTGVDSTRDPGAPLKSAARTLARQRQDVPDSATTEGAVRVAVLDQLFAHGSYIAVTGLGVAAVVFLALRGQGLDEGLWWWGALFTLGTLARLGILYLRRRYGGDPRRWLRPYALATMATGLCWASLVFFYNDSLTWSRQLFILVMLLGIPVAAISGNAVHRPVYYLFSTPIMLALLYWAIFRAPGLQHYFFTVGVTYIAIIWIEVRIYSDTLARNIATGIENQRLVEHLSALNTELSRMAYFDPLTGLANRRRFQEQIEAALERSRRMGSEVALMLVDVDNFKQVNDRFGHEAGDRLLVGIADRLRACLRQTDSIAREGGEAARLGGDEFIVLLENVDGVAGATRTAKRIRERLGQGIELTGDQRAPTVSIGIALAPVHAQEAATLIRRADIALYQAKQAGRDRYRVFDSDDGSPAFQIVG